MRIPQRSVRVGIPLEYLSFREQALGSRSASPPKPAVLNLSGSQ